MSENFGTARVSVTNGQVSVDHADDVIQMTGELAETLGVKAPLGGRVTLAEGYVYDLSDWDGQGSMPGRVAGTFVGRRVH